MGAPGRGEEWYDYQKAIDEEVEAARGSRASLDARLDEALNEDGTVKGGTATAVNWKASGHTPTYVSTTTFTVPGDETLIYVAGRRLSLALGGSTVYNTVESSSHAGGTTTVTVKTANLTNQLSAVNYGIVSSGSTGSLPKHNHESDEQGGEIEKAKHVLVAKTANYNVLASDLNGLKTFTNNGAAGEINFSLPAGSANYKTTFIVVDAQYLKVTANGTEKFRYGGTQGAAGGYIRENTVGTVWTITWSGDDWVIAPLTGTLKYDE